MEQYKAFETVLMCEIELLAKIPPLQNLIRDAIVNREWADYEALMESVGKIGERFGALEAKRETLAARLSGGNGQEHFYAWTARLPERERNTLTTLYRNLKMETLQIKLSNDTLMEYLKEARSAVSGILESAYPERRGTLYTRDGTSADPDMKSVVLNRHF
jgi:hypothetical protein